MANVKITDLTAYANPASTDVLPIVDVGADVTKKVSIADLLKNAPAGTAAAPGIAFDGDNTGIYSPGADQLAISTNGTGRLFVDASGDVGIGTASPVVACDVVGQVRASTGILFGSDTPAANALDDYEEGNWIPGNLDTDLTVGAAKYIKIGRLVHAWFTTINNNTTATFDLPSNVQGLPYVRKMTGPYSNYGLLAGTVSVINNITYSGSQIVWNGVVTGRFNDPDGCNIRWKNDTTESAPNLKPQIVNAPVGGIYFDFHVAYESES